MSKDIKDKDLGELFSEFESRLSTLERILVRLHGKETISKLARPEEQPFYALPSQESLGEKETEQVINLTRRLMRK